MTHPIHAAGPPPRPFGSGTLARGLAGGLAPLLVVAACGGPNEKAGSERDEAAAAAQGDPYSGSGPNERIGEVEDRAADAAQNVRDADAEALRARGENLQRQADIEAARLDEKSRSIREAADERADNLDEQAEAARRGKTVPARPDSAR